SMKKAVPISVIAEDLAIPPAQLNPCANIICSRSRLRADPNLIAREGTPPALKQDWISSSQYCREPQLECGISFQDFRARSVCAENGTPRLHRARHHVLLQRRQKSRWRLLEFR